MRRGSARKGGLDCGRAKHDHRGVVAKGRHIAALAMAASCAARAPAPATGHDEIRFSHNAHAQAKVGCGMCHRSTREPGQPASDFRPSMAGCLACHQQWKDRCEECHTDARFARPWQTGS
ncbi:MAG TPA: hypothetical protein VIR81_11075 [Myxococcales bacterium]